MIELKPLTEADVDAHNDGEDAETIRWLSGGPATSESTRRHFTELAANATAGQGKRGFGVWLDGELAGYVDACADSANCQQAGDVNISYATHPWARGRGVAARAVELICEFIVRERMGTAALIVVEPENRRSVRVAEKAGFSRVGSVALPESARGDGAAVPYLMFRRSLVRIGE